MKGSWPDPRLQLGIGGRVGMSAALNFAPWCAGRARCSGKGVHEGRRSWAEVAGHGDVFEGRSVVVEGARVARSDYGVPGEACFGLRPRDFAGLPCRVGPAAESESARECDEVGRHRS